VFTGLIQMQDKKKPIAQDTPTNALNYGFFPRALTQNYQELTIG